MGVSQSAMIMNLLLLYPRVLFYKVPVLSMLSDFLRGKGYHLCVWPTSIDRQEEEVDFTMIDRPMTFRNYQKVLREHRINLVVTTLMRREPGLCFYVGSVLYARATGRRAFYYGHGLNLSRRTAVTELFGSNVLHLIFDGLILYTPSEKKFLWKMNCRKAGVAYNTLDMQGKDRLIARSKEEILRSLGIRQQRIVLFSGRIQPRKRLDVLLDSFERLGDTHPEWALVIVGPGLDGQAGTRLLGRGNVYYLGPLYDRTAMAEVFSACDVFSIPGAMGLGIVESLYWGKPILTLNVDHGPEAYYLNERNSFLCNEPADYVEKMRLFMDNPDLITVMGQAAREAYVNLCTMDRFLDGFYAAISRSGREDGYNERSR